MNEQICLSFTEFPDGTQSANFSIFPVLEDGTLDVANVKTALIHGPSSDSSEETLVEAIVSAITAFRSSKSI